MIIEHKFTAVKYTSQQIEEVIKDLDSLNVNSVWDEEKQILTIELRDDVTAEYIFQVGLVVGQGTMIQAFSRIFPSLHF